MALLIHYPNQSDERVVALDAQELNWLQFGIEERIDRLLTKAVYDPAGEVEQLRKLLVKLKETK